MFIYTFTFLLILQSAAWENSENLFCYKLTRADSKKVPHFIKRAVLINLGKLSKAVQTKFRSIPTWFPVIKSSCSFKILPIYSSRLKKNLHEFSWQNWLSILPSLIVRVQSNWSWTQKRASEANFRIWLVEIYPPIRELLFAMQWCMLF